MHLRASVVPPLGASLVLSDEWIAIYLAGFAGIVIYLATSPYLAGGSCTPFISLDDCFHFNRCRNHVDFSELSAFGRRT
jgi:hypothetical protein